MIDAADHKSKVKIHRYFHKRHSWFFIEGSVVLRGMSISFYNRDPDSALSVFHNAN